MTKNVDVDFKKGSRKVAPFVSRVVGGKVVPNTGYETKTYTPPLVAPEKVTTVDDLYSVDRVKVFIPAEHLRNVQCLKCLMISRNCEK